MIGWDAIRIAARTRSRLLHGTGYWRRFSSVTLQDHNAVEWHASAEALDHDTWVVDGAEEPIDWKARAEEAEAIIARSGPSAPCCYVCGCVAGECEADREAAEKRAEQAEAAVVTAAGKILTLELAVLRAEERAELAERTVALLRGLVTPE